jgi:hypothetical protein
MRAASALLPGAGAQHSKRRLPCLLRLTSAAQQRRPTLPPPSALHARRFAAGGDDEGGGGGGASSGRSEAALRELYMRALEPKLPPLCVV